MFWDGYVEKLMADGSCQDCAIVEFGHNPSVLASYLKGSFWSITPQEIDVLVGHDRETIFTSGLTLGSKKCLVLRDRLNENGEWTMDIRTQSQGGEPTYNVAVGKANKILVLVMGKEGVHGGGLN